MTKTSKFTVIDLFSGCGGLTEGFLQTKKFDFLAHVEWEKPMVDTLKNNLVKRWKHSESDVNNKVILFDIQKTDELLIGNWKDDTIKTYGAFNSDIVIKKGMDGLVKNKKVDVIIGGPPCQAYSLAGRAQDPNSMKNDYRNYLFESFVKVVDHYKPKVFVFENVPGMLSAKPGDKLVIERIYEAFSNIGYEIRNLDKLHLSVYNSADFQVPQERKRLIIYGVNKNCSINLEEFYTVLDARKSNKRNKTVQDAIGNLPKFKPLEESYKKGKVNVSHELIGDNYVDLHIPRYTNKRDINVIKYWIENSMNYVSNSKKLEFYKSITGRTSNHNKYRNLEWNKPSPTIVSHLQKDGFMFIHPDINQLRTITIREAALLQSFPIDYKFIGSNPYCFKMIGNAVPVLFAKEIANSIVDVLTKENS